MHYIPFIILEGCWAMVSAYGIFYYYRNKWSLEKEKKSSNSKNHLPQLFWWFLSMTHHKKALLFLFDNGYFELYFVSLIKHI
jgi:hypothetical protein